MTHDRLALVACIVLGAGCVAGGSKSPDDSSSEAASTTSSSDTDSATSEAVGTSDSGVSSSSSGDEPPSSCASPEGEPESATEACFEYDAVLLCCFPTTEPSEVDRSTLCASSIDWLYWSDAEAPEACEGLMLAALECAIGVAESSCSDMADFYAGLETGITNDGVGPPSDETMPCHAEVLAVWDAGCEPYFF